MDFVYFFISKIDFIVAFPAIQIHHSELIAPHFDAIIDDQKLPLFVY